MNNQKGSMLVVIIVMMVIISVLGAGFLVINGTSFMTSAKSGNFNNALYLAEAGLRYGQADLFPRDGRFHTYTMTDTWQQMLVKKDINGQVVTATGLVYPGTALEARMTLTWWQGGSGPGGPGDAPPDTRDNNHNLLPVGLATFTNGDLSALNLTNIPGRVQSQAYIATGGTHTYWAAFINMAANKVADSDNPSCYIGYLFAPISGTYVDLLRAAYTTYQRVSYEMQTKVGWLVNINYAAQGLNFRWKKLPSGKYQGYAVSFMVFNSATQCNNNPDYIPNDIKPPGNGNPLSERLLLVLWKQWVDSGGVERRKWLAYAELGRPAGVCDPTANCVRNPADNDPMVTGWQVSGVDGRVTDDSTIGIRVEDIISGGQHHNEIRVFYGDGSPNFDASSRRTADAFATNTNRQRYLPQWINNTVFTTWPSHSYEARSSTDNTLIWWSYTNWLSKVSYIQNEIAIPTTRLASDSQPHNYKVTGVTPPGKTDVNEPVWPVGSGSTVTDNNITWTENGTARPTTQYDYFTVLSANPNPTGLSPSPPNPSVVWNLNSAAVTSGEITLSSDNSTIRTYEFVLDSFPSTQDEIGLHGFVNSDDVALSFDDLSLIIMGYKE